MTSFEFLFILDMPISPKCPTLPVLEKDVVVLNKIHINGELRSLIYYVPSDSAISNCHSWIVQKWTLGFCFSLGSFSTKLC